MFFRLGLAAFALLFISPVFAGAAILPASSETEFPTPADPAWPVITFSGTSYPLTVSRTDVPAIPVGSSYASWSALRSAVEVVAPVIVDLPAGELGQGVSIGCKDMVVRGQVDQNGYPLTGIPNAAFRCDTRQAFWTLKNVRIGPTDAALALDPKVRTSDDGSHGQLTHNGGGRLNLINIKSRNSSDNGISAFPKQGGKWPMRRTAELWMYDSEVWGHGTDSGEHNIYVHDLRVFAFIRSISRDVGGSHELKADGNGLIVVDSALVHMSYAGSPGARSESAVLNMSRAQDIRLARNLITDNTGGGGSSIQLVARTSNNGGFSTKTPPVFDVEDMETTARWVSNPMSEASKTILNAQVALTAAAGATTLELWRIGPYPDQGGGTTLSLTENYAVRVYLNDNTIQEFVGKPSAVSVSRATFTVPGGLRAAAKQPNMVALKKAADPWDTPILNSEFWNRNDPNYWWRQIKDASGKLDLTKQNLFDTVYLEDTLVRSERPANSSAVYIESRWQHAYWAHASNNPEVPVPPLNRPQGATADWPNVVGASEWKEPLMGPGLPVNGRNPSGFLDPRNQGPVSDMIWPWPFFVADLGIWKGSKPVQQFHVGDSPQYLPDVRWLNGSGSLVSVLDTNKDPLPTGGQGTLITAHSAGVQTLSVSSTVGCSVGQKVMVELPLKPGAARAIHISTIDQTPGGTTLHMANGLVRAASVNAAVVCLPKAGARPSTWVTSEHYADGLSGTPLSPPAPVPPPTSPQPQPAPPTISNIQIFGDFTQTNTCTSALAVGQSCAFQITFKPTVAGSRTSALSFVDAISGATKSIALMGRGEGTAQPPPTLPPGTPVKSILTSNTSSWVVPSNWNPVNNSIECIGAGGDGQTSVFGGGAGGGGGAYARINNLTLSPGANVSYKIGAHVSGAGDASNETYFNGSTKTTATVICDYGKRAGTGGSATNSKGTIVYSGGDGGAQGGQSSSGGAGGGGSAGPTGAGKAGAIGRNGQNGAGGGGGGSNGGSSTVGSAGTSGTAGGSGGHGTTGAGGGLAGNASAGGTGSYGGGGGGGGTVGGVGGCDVAFDSTHGACGGGGGGDSANAGGAGGTYGGGGGGGGGLDGMGGIGGQGIIVITYTPTIAGASGGFVESIFASAIELFASAVTSTMNFAAALLSLSPTSFDFGSVTVGSSLTKTLTLTVTDSGVTPTPAPAPEPIPDPDPVPEPEPDQNPAPGGETYVPTTPTPPPGGGGGPIPTPTQTPTPTPPPPPTQTPPVSTMPGTPSSVSPVFTRTLQLGSRGDDVKALQIFLTSQGFQVVPPGEETTFFGPATAAALMRYQEAYRAEILTPNGLSNGTGAMGPATRAFINKKLGVTTQVTQQPASQRAAIHLTRSLTFGSRGTDVATLQAYLIGNGYLASDSATGYFGPLTREAVRRLQCERINICSGDSSTTGWGVVGPKTRAVLK